MNSKILMQLISICFTLSALASQGRYEWSVVPYPFKSDNRIINNNDCSHIEVLNDHEAVYFDGSRSVLLIKNDGDSIQKKIVCDTALYGNESSDTMFPFKSISFADTLTGYIAGVNSNIYKTTDGGQSWGLCLRGVRQGGMGWSKWESTLFSIAAYDSNTVWAVGKEGYIVHTENGGKNWNEAKYDSVQFSEDNVYQLYDYDFHSIAVVNDTICFIAGNHGALSILLETTDGGSHWKEVVTRRFGTKIVSIAYSGTTLWISTDHINYKGTFDAGSNILTWNEEWAECDSIQKAIVIIDSTWVMSTSTSGGFYNIWSKYTALYQPSTIDALQINTISSSKSGVLWAASKNGTIYRSTDHGESWYSSVRNGFYPSVNLNSICFTNPQNGYICGDRGIILNTNDSGKTWAASVTKVCASASFRVVYFPNIIAGWVIGRSTENREIYFRTTDRGKNWKLVDSAAVDISVINFDLRKRCSISADTVLILESYLADSRIITETGGGKEALAVVDHADSRENVFTSITFSTNDIGWVTGSNGLILKSTDHGTIWKKQPVFTQSMLEKVSFFNPGLGLILGSNSVFITKDSGTTWDEVPVLSGKLTDIVFTDSANCLAVGENGLILNLKIGDIPMAVLSPLKNDVAGAGDSLTIRWQGIKIDKLSILISFDNGNNYTTYVAETDNDGEERIRISANAKPGNSCIVVIRSLDGSVQVQSGPFTVRETTGVGPEFRELLIEQGVKINKSKISYYSPASGTPVGISIFNPLGRNVYSCDFRTVSSGRKIQCIPDNVLKNGYYLARIRIGSKEFQEWFLVCRRQ